MNFGLLIIGDEILSGKRQDKHLPKVIELLAARGLALSWARYVGDDPARITADLKDAFCSGDVVFSCGGIGATPDDHTRQCASSTPSARAAHWRVWSSGVAPMPPHENTTSPLPNACAKSAVMRAGSSPT